MTHLCRLCKAPANNNAIDPAGDMTFIICERCIQEKSYFLCSHCDTYYPLSSKRKNDDGPLCVYCTGEQNWPFYEEVPFNE